MARFDPIERNHKLMNEDNSDEEMDEAERFAHIATQLTKGAYDGEEDWKLFLVLGMAISEIEQLDDRDLAYHILNKLVNTLTFAHLHTITFSYEGNDEETDKASLPPITEAEIQSLSDRLFGRKEED